MMEGTKNPQLRDSIAPLNLSALREGEGKVIPYTRRKVRVRIKLIYKWYILDSKILMIQLIQERPSSQFSFADPNMMFIASILTLNSF